MKLLSEALGYLEMGWAVYPAHSINRFGFCSCGNPSCPCPGKHPVGRWMEYQGRLPTEKEVEVWFSALDCNIGTITGTVSGIAVVDVDSREGLDNFKKLNLAPTLQARSGGGGYHFFYELKTPASTRSKIMEGVDIRADGGFIILAPSNHASGRQYEWMTRNLHMAPFDVKVFERYSSSTIVLPWVENILKGVGEGERSNSAARLAGRYIGMGLSAEETWILLRTWNTKNQPPLDLRELKITLEWAQRKHLENGNGTGNKIVTVQDILNLFPSPKNN